MDNLTIKVRDLLIREIEGDISIEDVDIIGLRAEYSRIASIVIAMVREDESG